MKCPQCGFENIELQGYESMIVVARNLALFTVRCPSCGARVSGLHAIPPELHDEVQYAAIQVGAGMGRDL